MEFNHYDLTLVTYFICLCSRCSLSIDYIVKTMLNTWDSTEWNRQEMSCPLIYHRSYPQKITVQLIQYPCLHAFGQSLQRGKAITPILPGPSTMVSPNEKMSLLCSINKVNFSPLVGPAWSIILRKVQRQYCGWAGKSAMHKEEGSPNIRVLFIFSSWRV